MEKKSIELSQIQRKEKYASKMLAQCSNSNFENNTHFKRKFEVLGKKRSIDKRWFEVLGKRSFEPIGK